MRAQKCYEWMTFIMFILALVFVLCNTELYGTGTQGKDTGSFPIPLGLPPIPWPADNPYSKQKAELGKLLFFDKRLSSDATVSCASCHSKPYAYADRHQVALGIHGHKGTRHAPTVINTAYLKLLFWDGRAKSLEEQAKGPIANPNEMALANDVHEAHKECHERIKKIQGYGKMFKEVFGNENCSIDDVAKAIATFERTVLSGNSSFDRYHAGDKQALSEQEIKGYQVFRHSSCDNCHYGDNFTDGRFLNIGIGMDVPNPDLGRYNITKEKKDWGAFKVPTLREIANTYPYMHDGSLKTLEEVIDYYDKGGTPNANLHPSIRKLNLSKEDKEALLSFLKALSGDGWQHFKEPKQFPK